MAQVTLRALEDDDWPAILDLAERSLREVAIAPSQRGWMENRRSFSASDGIQQHFVAISGERIVGYACLEHRNNRPDGEYRLFVVVEPTARATLGTELLARLRECLIRLDARQAWLTEYAADAGFLSYLEEMGFVRTARFNLDDGTAVVKVTMLAPFQPLASRDRG